MNWKDPEKKAQLVLFNKTLLNKLKAYAIETDQSFHDVIKGPFERFEADLLQLSQDIDKIRQAAIVANIPQEEPLVIQ